MIHLRHYTQSDIPWDLTTTTWYGSGQLGDGFYPGSLFAKTSLFKGGGPVAPAAVGLDAQWPQ